MITLTSISLVKQNSRNVVASMIRDYVKEQQYQWVYVAFLIERILNKSYPNDIYQCAYVYGLWTIGANAQREVEFQTFINIPTGEICRHNRKLCDDARVSNIDLSVHLNVEFVIQDVRRRLSTKDRAYCNGVPAGWEKKWTESLCKDTSQVYHYFGGDDD